MGHDFDDDFAVYPFRRLLVEETVADVRAPRPVPRPAPTPAAPRSGPNPLKVAVPLALTTFVVAVAGAATISNGGDVQQAISRKIVPVAEAAAPRQRPVAAKLVFVPDVTGLKLGRAVAQLKQAGFHPRFRRVHGKPGVVLEQRPKAATEVRRAGIVVLLAGRAKPKAKPRPAPVVVAKVIVTSVVGLDRDTAVRALRNEGLGIKIFGVPSSRPAGTVVAQSPRPGTRAAAGTYARINVSVG